LRRGGDDSTERSDTHRKREREREREDMGTMIFYSQD
jgi:hypothetical protein